MRPSRRSRGPKLIGGFVGRGNTGVVWVTGSEEGRMAIFPYEGRINELNTLAGIGGANLYVRLFTNNILPDELTGKMDLLEASYSGYVPYNSALWSAPEEAANGDVVILSPVIVFTGPTAPPGVTVYGFFVTLGTGFDALLWMVERFAVPVPIALPNDQVPLRVEARLRYPAAP